MKLQILIVVFLTCFGANASGEPKKLSLDEMIKLSDAIALVKIIEYEELRDNLGTIYRKNLKVEVVDPILNLSRGEKIILLGHNGISGSDLGLDTVGEEAIVLMNITSIKTTGMNTYNSVGAKYSVFRKISDNCIEGLGFLETDISYEKAISKIRGKLKMID